MRIENDKYKIYEGDCLNLLSMVEDKSVDLVIIDPPYQIDNTSPSTNSGLARSIISINKELENSNICNGFNINILDVLVQKMKDINLYVWCNHKQIPMYLDFFYKQHNCNFDILIWNKTNAIPLFYNKYMTDKEYCLYFRKGGYCSPKSFDKAKTVFHQPSNVKDKKIYNHPTIKPLNIIETLVVNSSREGDVVLDCFMGTGTTGVACVKSNRKFIGMEINPDFYKMAVHRLKMENQPSLFD